MPNNNNIKPTTINWPQILLHHLNKSPPPSLPLFKQIHSLFLTTGLSLHSLPFSRLLSLSSLLSPLSSPSLLLHSPLSPSPFLSNTLISSLSSSNHHFLALSLLPSFHPNSHTYPSLLKALSFSPQLIPFGLALHSQLIKILPLPLDPFLLTSLLLLHSRNKTPFFSCKKLFDLMKSPDLVAWNAILSCARGNEVLELFRSLQMSSFCARPNEITLLYLIGACGDLGDLGCGVWAHAYIVRSRGRVVVNRFLGGGLIDMYGKCGRLDVARQVFDGLREKDVFCYNALMRGFAARGDGDGALGLLEEIGRGGVRPDGATFSTVMSACAHAGMVEEGRRCFERMEMEFGMKPGLEHYGCLVDVLGRSGRLEEAVEVVRTMPMEPNGMMLRSLLGACRVYGEFDERIGVEVVCKLMELDPDHGGNYVLLSNVCADFGRWDGAFVLRKEMRDRGVGKRPGLSCVEIDGVVEEFCIGDQRHVRMSEIYEMIHQISRGSNITTYL